MQRILVQNVVRRRPFRMEHVPWLVKVYRFPFDRWQSLGRQALFGAPNLILFYLYQKLIPIPVHGMFAYLSQQGEKKIRYDGRNSQFSALYFKELAAGYEPQTTALLDLILPPDGVFWDVGSNWGLFSLFVASKPGFIGQIHAFEPYPPSFRDLNKVVNAAGLSGMIRCHGVALSDCAGEAVMQLPTYVQSGLAVMKDEPVGGRSRGDAIRMATIDSLDLPAPAVMKVDVEGAEFRVFSGGAKMLARYRPMIVFENSRCMDDPSQTLRPLVFLRDLGYVFFHIGWLKKTGSLTYLVGDDSDARPQDHEKIFLQQFDLEDRLLRPLSMNIMACHLDFIERLEQAFISRSDLSAE